jgi:glycosyltransferase involved in cell wall biosynthesis
MGHDVVIYSAWTGRHMLNLEHLDGIPVHHLPVTRVPHIRAGYIPTPRWLGIVALEEFDIIHAHSLGYFPSYTGALISMLADKPFVLTAHQPPTDAAFENKLLASFFNRGPGRLALQRASRIIALTKLEAAYLQTKYGLDRARISVIPNGVELETFRPTERTRRGKRSSILYVGRFSEEKGIFDLLDAIPYVLEKIPGASFTFVGDDGDTARKIRQIVQRGGISRNVTILGPKFGGALADAYADADVFVAPSLYETFGITILEAMAVGLPVVATAVGGIPELVRDMVNGILVQRSDHEKLAEAIIKLLSNRELATRISQSNIAKARSYSWERIATAVLQVYAEAMERKS